MYLSNFPLFIIFIIPEYCTVPPVQYLNYKPITFFFFFCERRFLQKTRESRAARAGRGVKRGLRSAVCATDIRAWLRAPRAGVASRGAVQRASARGILSGLLQRPWLALHPFGSEAPARVLSGDLLRPHTLEETGETVDLHLHPFFAGEHSDDASAWSDLTDPASSLDGSIRVLSPIQNPPVFLGTGLNYHRHAEECGLPAPAVPILAFCKPSTALQQPGRPIAVPKCCDPNVPELDWEVELAVVIGTHRGAGALCKDTAPWRSRLRVGLYSGQ